MTTLQAPNLRTLPSTPTTGVWWVLHTKPRQEKALADDLDHLSISYFLPLQNTVRYYGKRKCHVDLPLFPGYVFLNGTKEQAIQADRTKRVATIITVRNQDQLARELGDIQTALNQGATLTLGNYIDCGDTVEVTAGPFKGLRGIVERHGAQSRLILGVQLIERAAVLEIDHALLRRVD